MSDDREKTTEEKLVKVNLAKPYSYAPDCNNVVTAGPGEAELPERFVNRAQKGGFIAPGEQKGVSPTKNKATSPAENKAK